MTVTVEDFAELRRLKRPQLRILAAADGVPKAKRHPATDDALRLYILEARAKREADDRA